MIHRGFLGTVADLMTRDPLVIDQRAPLLDAAELMDSFEITGLPVIDDDGRLVGVLSQADLVRVAATNELGAGWQALAVRDLMTSPAIWVPTWCTLEDAAKLMELQGIHRVVVVADDEQTPIGIVSMSDFVRLIAEDSQHA